MPASARKRPAAYSDWIDRGRATTPEIDLGTFPPQWSRWWRHAQPPAHEVDPENLDTKMPHPRTETEIDWSTLRIPSRNGFYLFLIGLVWWRTAIEQLHIGKSAAVEEWCAEVEDVAWVVSVWTMPSQATPASLPAATVPAKSTSKTAIAKAGGKAPASSTAATSNKRKSGNVKGSRAPKRRKTTAPVAENEPSEDVSTHTSGRLRRPSWRVTQTA